MEDGRISVSQTCGQIILLTYKCITRLVYWICSSQYIWQQNMFKQHVYITAYLHTAKANIHKFLYNLSLTVYISL